MRDTTTAAIRIVYLARLREALGTADERVVPPEGVKTVADLRATLRARGGVWASELGAGRAVRFAVNHALAGADTPIADGDEVAIFPPVTGG